MKEFWGKAHHQGRRVISVPVARPASFKTSQFPRAAHRAPLRTAAIAPVRSGGIPPTPVCLTRPSRHHSRNQRTPVP